MEETVIQFREIPRTKRGGLGALPQAAQGDRSHHSRAVDQLRPRGRRRRLRRGDVARAVDQHHSRRAEGRVVLWPRQDRSAYAYASKIRTKISTNTYKSYV